MRQLADAWLEHQRRRFIRYDARRWLRHDAHRYKAYNPDQPRVPAGTPEGGQWTGEGGAPATPLRIAQTDRPPPPGTGLRFALQIALQMIRGYRRENNLVDLFDSSSGSTVAVTTINGKFVYGVNSDIADYSGAYTADDEAAAKRFRDSMIEKYPDVMKSDNVGEAPNDALFHAEATVLLRAARENGGTLEGKSLVVFVDKTLCRSCQRVLPFVGLELGNPTVTFVDRRGVIRTMRSGSWD
jgi:hypothetical protein